MYRITQVLSVGPFASPERAAMLRAAGVTHILNVSDATNALSSADGFREVDAIGFDDDAPWPTRTMKYALDTLHRMASEPGSHVYVHCVAGHIRSPTILWLYLIALGIPPNDARNWIEDRSPVASPGHPLIVHHEHVLQAQLHGLEHFFPHPRPDIIVPIDLPLEASPQGADAPRSE